MKISNFKDFELIKDVQEETAFNRLVVRHKNMIHNIITETGYADKVGYAIAFTSAMVMLNSIVINIELTGNNDLQAIMMKELTEAVNGQLRINIGYVK